MHSKREGRCARWALLVAAAAALALAQPVFAQDATAKKGAVKSTPKNKANLMTRDELRACMNEQDRLQQIRIAVEQGQASLDQQKAQVLAMDVELQKKVAALDPADEAGRKALEDEAVKRDQAADVYNARLAGLREQSKAFDTGRQAWVERCTTKDYDEMDEAAIKKERAQAARAPKK
jgi:hypothetical protein